MYWRGPRLAAGPDSLDKHVHLTAQAEAKGCIKERGGESRRCGSQAERSQPGCVPDHPDDGEDQAHALRKPWWRLVLQFRRRP